MKRATGRVLACVTVDVEDSDIESLQRIKEICQKNDTPITWFVDTKQCNRPETLDLLQMFVEEGDEVGLHIHWNGSFSGGLRKAHIERVQVELEEALKLLDTRFQLKSFRGGGLCQTTPVLRILEEKGFEFDSSVAYKLDEQGGWHQGHKNIHPVSAYYPSRTGYDVIAHDDNNRFTILEIPVTRAIPSPEYWCNLLEPGLTSVSKIRMTIREYFLRRHFQPLVIIIVLLHSWGVQKHPALASDLNSLLDYATGYRIEFSTIHQAGYEWEKVWMEYDNDRNTLLSSRFYSGPRTWLQFQWIRLAIFLYNLGDNPVYHAKAFVSRIYGYIMGSTSVKRVSV